jgi:hypothetical protein
MGRLGMRDYQKLKEQDAIDARRMAYANSQYLHHSTKTPHCTNVLECLLCTESARLAVQHYRPIIEDRVVATIMDLYNIRCRLPHPGSDD